jgi:hypothetical protein
MFRKKFKVRVNYHSSDYYMVEYANYRFIPNWTRIERWYDRGFLNDLQGFTPILFKFDEAEEFAAKFKTIEDVQFHNDRERLLQEQWEKREKEYRAKTIPYQTKQIL